MNNMECLNNCGCEIQIKRNKDDIREIWHSVDSMRKWVITSAGTVILFVFTVIANFVLQRFG